MANVMAPCTDSIMGSLPRAKAGVGSAVNDTTRQMGGAVGVAVFGSLMASHFTSAHDVEAVEDRAAAGAAQVTRQRRQGSRRRPSRPRPAKPFASQIINAANDSFVGGMHLVARSPRRITLLAAVGVACSCRLDRVTKRRRPRAGRRAEPACRPKSRPSRSADGRSPRARVRPGRRRDPACDAAILAATLEIFVEEGYARREHRRASRPGPVSARRRSTGAMRARPSWSSRRCGPAPASTTISPTPATCGPTSAACCRPWSTGCGAPTGKVLITFDGRASAPSRARSRVRSIGDRRQARPHAAVWSPARSTVATFRRTPTSSSSPSRARRCSGTTPSTGSRSPTTFPIGSSPRSCRTEFAVQSAPYSCSAGSTSFVNRSDALAASRRSRTERGADDDEPLETEISQPAQGFDAVLGRSEDAEPVGELVGEHGRPSRTGTRAGDSCRRTRESARGHRALHCWPVR